MIMRKGAELPTGYKPRPEDSGVRGPSMGGRLVKGSPEIKEKMRKLRAMRKKKK